MHFDDTTAVITGTGSCLPADTLSNNDIISTGDLETTDDWIRTRTGITHRRRISPGQATSDLATAAGGAAIASAGSPTVDMVILATTTPDHPCPATAPQIAHRLNLGTVPAFDMAAVCSGFLYALATATALIRGGLSHTCLVIGADTYSTIVDPHDRETAALFGDGAGAAVLSLGSPATPGAIHAVDLGSDGSGRDLITIPARRLPPAESPAPARTHRPLLPHARPRGLRTRRPPHDRLRPSGAHRGRLGPGDRTRLHRPPGQPTHSRLRRRPSRPADRALLRKHRQPRQHRRSLHPPRSHRPRRPTPSTPATAPS